MARYAGATWEPVTNHTDGPFDREILGIVLHCNGVLDNAPHTDLRNFFQNSSGQGAVSSHFQVGKDGTVFQYTDSAWTAWCQGDGNAQYLSIESEGQAGEAATPQQVAAIGGILRFVSQEHGIPLQLAERPGDRGFGWHGMGAAAGADWGHATCPGVRKDQRNDMLAAAGALTPSGGGTQEGDDDVLSSDDPIVVEIRGQLSELRRMIGGLVNPGSGLLAGAEETIAVQSNGTENRRMLAELVTGNISPAGAAVGEKSIATQVKEASV